MSDSSRAHPALDVLLLWQSGELDPPAAAGVDAHLEVCSECRARVGSLTTMLGDISSIGRAAHSPPPPTSSPWLPRLAWAAASLAVAVVVAQFVVVTPSAKADELLARAADVAPVASVDARRFSADGVTCDFHTRVTTVSTGGARRTPDALCADAAGHFEAIGWTSGDPLSAGDFRRWRATLPRKQDSVATSGTATEITTTTDASVLRRATVRLQTSDYRVVAARFEFAASGSRAARAFDVTAATADPALVMETNAVEATPAAAPTSTVARVPAVADEAEADVRLLLHELGLDDDVLVAVQRRGAGTEVWGTVADAASVAQLEARFTGSPHVRLDVGPESAATGRPPAWQTFQGDLPPLLDEQISVLFDAAARRQLVADLDRATRRLVGQARARDGLSRLRSRMPVSVRDEAIASAIGELEAGIAADLATIDGRLDPLLASSSTRPTVQRRLSAEQAVELYGLVHQLVFLGRRDSDLTLDAAVSRTRVLLR